MYFECRIYATTADLQRAAAHHEGHALRHLHRTQGLCTPFSVRHYVDAKDYAAGQRSYTKPICGRIYFADTQLNSMVIAHECGHAALAYAERRKFRPHTHGQGRFTSDGEERFCRVLGDMVGWIYWQLMRRGYQTVQVPTTKGTGRVFT